MTNKTAKIETDKTLDVKEPEELDMSTEARLERLEAHAQQSIVVSNNLITYCNTMEKWRKMEFVPKGEETSEEESTVDESNEG
jgi:hypothetical protein